MIRPRESPNRVSCTAPSFLVGHLGVLAPTSLSLSLSTSTSLCLLRAAIREFPALDLPVPDIVLALHACDTATDEALAVGVLSGAQTIMSVPCCQKDIQRQFQRQQQRQRVGNGQGSGTAAAELQQVQQVFGPLLDHGILKQRQLDLLTDTFRAQLLRLAGYR